MSDKFRMDLDGFARPAPTFAEASNDVRTAIAHLQQVIQAEGQCWGDDDPGKAFAHGTNNDGYTSDLQEGLQHLSALPDILEQVGSKIIAAANAVQRQDEGGAQGLRQASQF
ncbi:hypothetical protein [Nocardia sp. NPDC051570]|uniref:hypothetical protein n=1 Tax=Nocardia sp. NPDC051570 TaxID=3364324 RepID=UPI003789CDDE